jgi:hypothetical protein
LGRAPTMEIIFSFFIYFSSSFFLIKKKQKIKAVC